MADRQAEIDTTLRAVNRRRVGHLVWTKFLWQKVRAVVASDSGQRYTEETRRTSPSALTSAADAQTERTAC